MYGNILPESISEERAAEIFRGFSLAFISFFTFRSVLLISDCMDKKFVNLKNQIKRSKEQRRFYGANNF